MLGFTDPQGLFFRGYMRRREFITLVAAGATTGPLLVRAQTAERLRRIGILMGVAVDDRENEVRIAALLQGLRQLGWTDGRNVQIGYRWAGGSASDLHKHAVELAGLGPEVIFAAGGISLGTLLQVTRTVPIVFAIVPDPVGSGFVETLARPGGNATGFMQFEYSLSGKWPELLMQIAPGVTRGAVLWDPTIPSGVGQFAVIQAVAPSVRLDVSPISVRDPTEIERGIAAFARSPNGGLIVTASALAVVHRQLIVTVAAKNKLPVVYFQRQFVDDGGLISYGSDWVDQYRRAATYIHRILKGEKPADLPVQVPTKYELVINLKAAKAIGLQVPSALLTRADEVIE
jgi:putative ABC transport system substrate-binding protein